MACETYSGLSTCEGPINSPFQGKRQVKDYGRYKRMGGRNEEGWAKFVRRAFSFYTEVPDGLSH